MCADKSPAPRVPRWERVLLVVIALGFVVMGVREIYNRCFIGQDFNFHSESATAVFHDPTQFAFLDSTSRPLVYWVGALCMVCKAQNPWAASSCVFIAFAVVTIFLAHGLLTRVMGNPTLRLVTLACVVFLPQTVVATIVFAADAVATLPFFAAAYAAVRASEAETDGSFARWAAAAGAGVIVGNLAKATFLVMPAAILFALLVAWRASRLSLKRVLVGSAWMVVLPVGVGSVFAAMVHHALAGAPQRHSFDWKGTGEMTFQSWLLPKASDVRIFKAPYVFQRQMREGQWVLPLTINNEFSYPALLHLGLFSDVMNASAQHNGDSFAARRPVGMVSWSAKAGLVLGVPLSLLALLGMWGSFWGAWRPLFQPRTYPGFAAVLMPAMAAVWALPVVGILPFVHYAYNWGYWLPRLLVPAIWVFFACGFVALERWSGRRVQIAAVIVGAYVVVLVVIESRALWF